MNKKLNLNLSPDKYKRTTNTKFPTSLSSKQSLQIFKPKICVALNDFEENNEFFHKKTSEAEEYKLEEPNKLQTTRPTDYPLELNTKAEITEQDENHQIDEDVLKLEQKLSQTHNSKAVYM